MSVPPASSANEVLDEMEALTASYMGLLNDAEVNIGAPPLDSFDFEGEEEEEEEEEVVAEINEAAFEAAQEEGAHRPVIRSSNYIEVDDVLLVRAWSEVGMDTVHGMDQTGKRYWQRIEDKYCKLKPKTGRLVHRSYRSLQGRWEVIKPACARWSAAMDQVINAPPSGTVESDYETYADLRYKDMAGSKGKSFAFKHCWALLKDLDKWKPEGSKKAKERMKLEADASSLKDKLDQMIKTKDTLTLKALKKKLLIIERKKEVKLAKLEARRKDANRKAEIEDRMIKLKEAKA
nr:uncharacterized protein LOC127316219 [Lolium perenne]